MWIIASITHWIGHIGADQWTAAAACGTFLVALGAGITAAFQLGEARRLRLEQAQPYVVVFLEAGPAGDIWVDLVVKNFGVTAATDVRVEITQLDHVLEVPASIPTLVPGQEWRTLWDGIHRRKDVALPSEYRAAVTFRDSRGRESFDATYLLDWETLRRTSVTVYGTHDAAEALIEINKKVGGGRSQRRAGFRSSSATPTRETLRSGKGSRQLRPRRSPMAKRPRCRRRPRLDCCPGRARRERSPRGKRVVRAARLPAATAIRPGQTVTDRAKAGRACPAARRNGPPPHQGHQPRTLGMGAATATHPIELDPHRDDLLERAARPEDVSAPLLAGRA
jgi:hypothetical protein